jgi:hypothetical protein
MSNRTVNRTSFKEGIRLAFCMYCDEKEMSKDERQELAEEIAGELEWEADTYDD